MKIFGIEIGGSGNDAQNVDKKQPATADTRQKIIKTQLVRSRATIKKWTKAVAAAENVERPDRMSLIQVYNEIDRDAHLKSLMTQRANAVLSTPFYLTKIGSDEHDDDQTAKFNTDWFFKFMELSLDAVFYGHSLIQFGEIVNDGFKSLTLVPREYVIPEQSKVRTKLGGAETFSFVDPPFDMWAIGVGDPNSLGVLNNAVPLLVYKKDVLSAWSEYADLFGAPVRIGKTDVLNEVKRQNMDDMLDNMGSMAWGTFDRDDELTLVESNNRDAFNVFKEMILTANSELSKLILGQTGTSDEKSFVGSAEVHERIMNTYTAADKRMIQNVVNNQLLPLMVKHGMIPDGFEFGFDYTEKLTLEQKRSVIADLSPFYEFDPEWITEQFGVPITAVKTSGFGSFESGESGDPTNKLTTSQRVLINTVKLYDDAKKHKH